MTASAITTRWTITAAPTAATLADYGDLPTVVATVLHARGIAPQATRAFLMPASAPLGDPFLLPGIMDAIARIHAAHAARESICIYGDYDVDGLTSQALLVTALTAWGFTDLRIHTPHRNREGYGLNMEALAALARDGVRLVIAVDCGISDARTVAQAHELGLDIIIVDHHRIPATMPDAVAVINPHMRESAYPFADLAGVGVVYALVRALARSGAPFARPDTSLVERLLGFVALGTVADVVPLVGENRTLVTAGLKALRKTTHAGLRALAEIARVPITDLDAGHIGFALAPRLNAPGRLRGTEAAHSLLLPDSDETARIAAVALDQANRERKSEEARVLEAAIAFVENDPLQRAAKLLFLGSEGWTAGVVGLVAGKLRERYHRPVFVYERGETTSKGSARSIENFHLADALAAHAHLCLKQGGHARAAGFSVANDCLPALHAALLADADALTADDLTPTLIIDAEVPHHDLTLETARAVARLAPFGHGQPEPTFLVRNVRVRDARTVGADGSHLMFTAVLDTRATAKCIAFRLGERETELRAMDRVDLVISLQCDTWQGNERLELRVRDFRPAISG